MFYPPVRASARHARPLLSSLVIGGLSGTVGMSTEWGFSHLWGREPWQLGMLTSMWVPLLAAVGGTIIGRAIGDVVAGRPAGLRAPAIGLAAAAAVVALVVPLPRHGLEATATVTTTPTAAPQPAVDRYGRASILQPAQVALNVTPSAALDRADFLWVIAWEGGGKVTEPLIADGGGRFHTAATVPTGGAWKTSSSPPCPSRCPPTWSTARAESRWRRSAPPHSLRHPRC